MTAHQQLRLARTGLTAKMYNVPHNRIWFIRCICEFYNRLETVFMELEKDLTDATAALQQG